jgi:hypothetical protein
VSDPREPAPLLYHRGVPVPWIARWSAEVVTPKPAFSVWITSQGAQVGFTDESPQDRIDGVLWMRERDLPGVGDPEFKVVHSHRQRAAQVEGRCQVCGRIITERPVPWLIPKILMQKGSRGSIITDVAPTCEQCLNLARVTCPHLLSRPYIIVDVKDWRPAGLFGDVVELARRIPVPPPDAPFPMPRDTMIRHYQETKTLGGYLGNMMARQMVVELWNFTRRRTA